MPSNCSSPEKLFKASKGGDLAKVQELLKNGADANAAFWDEFPLHVAKTLEIGLALLDHGADIEVKDFVSGSTPLCRAANHDKWEWVEFYLDHGANVNATDESGRTALHLLGLCFKDEWTAEEDMKKREIARKLLDRGADLIAADHSGDSPLFFAASSCCVKMTQLLLEHGANANAVNHHGETPLHLAARNCGRLRSVATAKVLLEFGANVNAQTKNGSTPLLKAAAGREADGIDGYRRKEEMVLFLVGQGAEVNLAAADGTTPLHECLHTNSDEVCGVTVDIVCFLLNQGAEAHAVGSKGRKPLHFAAEFGNVGAAQVLMDSGGIVAEEALCEADSDGKTPLHVACAHCSHRLPTMVQLLLGRGAVVNVPDEHGNTPLHYVAARNEGLVSTARILLDQGALVNAHDHAGQTPLHRCIDREHFADVEMIQLLLDRGAQVNAACTHGWTPLHMEVEMMNQRKNILELLLERGGNVNAADSNGKTPLHKAVGSLVLKSRPVGGWVPINPDVVKLLLNHSPDLDAADCFGKTPLHYAAELGHYQTVQMLVDKGADMTALDSHGKTPLYYGALIAGSGKLSRPHAARNIVRLLLERGEFFS